MPFCCDLLTISFLPLVIHNLLADVWSFVRSCDLLTISFLPLVIHNHKLGICLRQGGCDLLTISFLPLVIHNLWSLQNLGYLLWFAYNFFLTFGNTQRSASIATRRLCCDLLTISFLPLVIHNASPSWEYPPIVVICLQFLSYLW